MAARTAPRTGRSQRSSLFGLTPGGVCRASELPRCWCALTAPFHPYRATSRRGLKVPRGGLLSVALSRTLRPADVIGHPVLWSPDFPPAAFATGSRPARLKTMSHDSLWTGTWGWGFGAHSLAEPGDAAEEIGGNSLIRLAPCRHFRYLYAPGKLVPAPGTPILCRRPIHACPARCLPLWR